MDQGEMELFRIQTEVYRRALEARETLESFSQSMAIEQRVEMYVLVLVAICLCILFKILNVNNSPEKSMFYCSNQKFLEEFLKKAPELAEPYIPTRFWGYSGHLQTIIQVSQGRATSVGLYNEKMTHLTVLCKQRYCKHSLYCQGVLQCIYSMDPDRNNLETFINITVQFYITQVYITYIYLYILAWVDILRGKMTLPFPFHQI